MRKYLLTTTLLIAFFSGYCQEKKLLENYTFRIDRFKALDFNIGAGGQQQNDYDFRNNTAGAVSAGFNMRFFSIKSTNRLLQTISPGLGLSGGSTKGNNNFENSKLKSLNILPSFFMNNKWYSKNGFVEVGTSFSDAFLSSRTNQSGAPVQNRFYNSNYLNGNVTLGVGKGRLENITDMQNALWLHNILLRDNNLNRKLTEEEIIGLARAITASNNRRILDGRRRIQFVLKNIDGYLQSKDVITKTDINYFSNLNDVVFFANNAARQAGTEKYIRVIPSLVNYSSKDENRVLPTTKNSSNEDGAEVVLKIGLQKFKPLSLKQQIDYGIAAKATYGKYNSRNDYYTNSSLDYGFNSNDEWKKIGLDYFLSYSMYPNTRTVVDIKLQGENGYQSVNGLNKLYHTAVLAANANYFISYNTLLNVSLGANYNQNNFDLRSTNRYNPSNLNSHNLTMFFNVGLNVAL
jgi:hypothetical protein